MFQFQYLVTKLQRAQEALMELDVHCEAFAPHEIEWIERELDLLKRTSFAPQSAVGRRGPSRVTAAWSPSGQRGALVMELATTLVPTNRRASLEVAVARDRPRLAFVYLEEPAAHEVYATEHLVAAIVWAASAGRGWDVRPVHGYVNRGGRIYAGAELVLDGDDFNAVRAGQQVLETLRDQILFGSRR